MRRVAGSADCLYAARRTRLVPLRSVHAYPTPPTRHACPCVRTDSTRATRLRLRPGLAHLGLRRRRRRQPLRPHGPVQDVRRRNLEDRLGRRDQLPRSRRLRRRDDHQGDHDQVPVHRGRRARVRYERHRRQCRGDRQGRAQGVGHQRLRHRLERDSDPAGQEREGPRLGDLRVRPGRNRLRAD